MAELADAARVLGLRLDGAAFGKGDGPLDRPAIAFLQGPRGGHFTVLRPVGTTGTMVQVIDPPYVPTIVDYDQLFASPTWTGRILLPVTPWYRRPALLPAAGALAVLLLTLALGRRRHNTAPAPRSAAS